MAESKNTRKPILIVAAIVIIALVAVYLYATHTPTPVVASGDIVEVYYTGMFQNGTVFNSNVGQQPLQFTVGSGQVITGFDNAVNGMTLNETKNAKPVEMKNGRKATTGQCPVCGTKMFKIGGG